MNKEDVYIPGMTNPDDAMMHGHKWSEEAKARVREARKAGRTVEEMFGKNWKKAGKAINKSANKMANKSIYKKSIASANKKVRILKRNAATANSKIRKMAKSSKITPKQVQQIRVANKKRLASAKRNLIKSKKHTTGRIVKDGAKHLLKKADKGVTNLINERAYNKDRAVTTKKEKKQIMNGLRKASKTANKVRNATYKKEVTKNGNTGVDGFKKKMLNKKAYNKTESKATSKAEKARNEALRKGQKEAVESVNNANKYKSTGDFINKQKKKLVNKAVTAVAAHNVDRNTKNHGGSVESKTKSKKPTTVKYKNATYTFKEAGSSEAEAAAKRSSKLARDSQIADEKKRIKKRFGIKQSATDDVYIPGLTGSSDAYLK